MTESFGNVIEGIRKTTLQLHKDYSILERICNMKPMGKQTEEFQKLQREVTLNRVKIEYGQIIRPNILVDRIVNDELDFVIIPIQENTEEVENQGDLFQTFRTCASELRDEYIPTKIIIPRNISNRILEWNRMMDSNSNETRTLNVGLEIPLDVIVLPLNYHFLDIVILCQNSLEVEYIIKNKNLLDVGLETDRGIDFPFWLRVFVRLKDAHYESIRRISTGNQ